MVYYEGKFYLVVELQFTTVYYGQLCSKVLPHGRIAVYHSILWFTMKETFYLRVELPFTRVYCGIL